MRLFEHDAFLLSQRIGRWRWPWAMAGTLCAVALMAGMIGALGLIDDEPQWQWLFDGNTLGDKRMLAPGALANYTTVLGIFLPFFLAPWIVFRVLHGRRWSDWPFLVGAPGVATWPAFFKGSAAMLLGYGVIFAALLVLDPSRFAWNGRDVGHLPWFGLGLAVLLVQTFAEEAAFKGYLVRVLGAIFPFRWPLALLLSIAFTILHWDNEDFAQDRAFAVVSFIVGSLISYALYYRTHSLAAPTGLHFGNNVFAMLILAQSQGGYPAAGLATYTDPVIAAGRSNITSLESWMALIALNAGVMLMLTHRRSPLFIAAAQQALPLQDGAASNSHEPAP